MNKKICLLLLFFIPIFYSCEFSAPAKNSEKIQTIISKTTLKPFFQLENSAVFTISAYVRKSILSKKNEEIGIIIIVVDLKNNEIFDWCFYEGIEGYVKELPVKMGEEKDLYYIPCYNSNKLLRLDSKNAEISEVPLTEHIYAATSFAFTNVNTNFNIISMSATHSSYNKFGCFFKIYDCKQDSFSESLFVDYHFSLLSPSFFPDRNNTIWFTQSLLSEDNKINCNIRNISSNAISYSEPIFTLTSNETPEKNLYGCDFLLNYINENNLFFIKCMDNDTLGVSIVNKSSETFERTDISLPHVVKCFEVNGDMYFLTNNTVPEENSATSYNFIAFYKFNQESIKCEKLTNEIPFNFLDSGFIYGNKIYIVDYLDHGDIKYASFDIVTNTFSEINHINFNEYLESLF